jgi:cytochrome c peroxidase
MKKFNANMSNDGESAKAACHSLTKGLDKKAFPVS